MFQIVIVMLKCRTGIIRRIYIDALNLSGVFAFQRFQRQQVIPVNQHILAARVRSRVGQGGIFNQQTRFYTDQLILAVPGQFQLISQFALSFLLCIK